MRRVLASLLVLAACLTLAAQPALVPVDEAGYRKLLAANQGKVLLVDFWATWCVPCRTEMPRLVKLEAALRNRGFRLLTVSADEPEQEAAARKFIQQQAAPLPAYLKRTQDDEKFINSVDPKWSGALPALFLYDRSGRKAASFVGETEIPTIEAAIRKLL
jgi:thiol-disulfide isomerase/thioredoxin